MKITESLSSDPHPTQRVEAAFERLFSRTAKVAVAPGRINLVGEHTDYNDGFVLPLAIDRYVTAAFAPRHDREIHVHTLDLNESAVVDLDDLAAAPQGTWIRYVAGVAWALQEDGAVLRGADLVLHGDVPIGAGLSSSAALELAVLRALAAVSHLDWDPERMARLARKAENQFVGVSCGIMDQYVVAASQGAAALLLDCRTLSYEEVAIPDEAVVYILDTGVRRKLAEEKYDERVGQCREAVRITRGYDPDVSALRDVSPELLEVVRPEMPALIYRRAKHVVDEMLRPQQMASALRANDLFGAGAVMRASHAGLRDLYEVSSTELDFVVEYANAHDACYGARLTGAGLGGCAVALVDPAGRDDFAEWITKSYQRRFNHPSAFYACRPAQGAHLL